MPATGPSINVTGTADAIAPGRPRPAIAPTPHSTAPCTAIDSTAQTPQRPKTAPRDRDRPAINPIAPSRNVAPVLLLED
ncbi:MAG: hypothetical protein MH825_00480 [Cyanobacteria bacterium]|nr:hypothetical protein [Cyanobacteriota bacterium]